MKRKLVFATNNAHKLEEISAILGEKVELLSLKDINCHADIPETADTLEGNAMLKAEYIFENYGLDCFADDTGLEVEALNGAPGVYSARYAGGGSNYENFTMLKEHIPLSVKTLGVAITKEDFESLAMLVDGVNKAKADYECGRKLTVYISPDGGAVASSELINF